MQKLINAIAIVSGAISLTLVGSGIFLYVNKDSLIDSAKEKIMSEVGALAGDAVKDMIPSTPSLPSMTGPVAPRSPRSGLGIPQF
jgi:hypothetical protein|tara:strand:- start:564 stop:818 length:255 start_codon:yes stop_codon:yes gene_type:complete